MYKKVVNLNNGLKAMLYKTSDKGIVKIALHILQGSVHENDNNNGISHMLEHVISTGLKEGALCRKLWMNGAQMTATTRRSYTVYEIDGLSESLDLYVQVLSQILFNPPEITPELLEKERKVILCEQARYYSSLNQIQDRCMQALFGDRNIGRMILGNTQIIKSLSAKSLLKLYRNTYIPKNSVLVIYGDFNLDIATTLAEKHFGLYKKQSICTPKIEDIADAPSHYVNSNVNGEFGVISIGHRIKTADDFTFLECALKTLLAAQTNPMITYRTAYELRIKHGIAYSIGGFIKNYQDIYCIGISAVVKNTEIIPAIRIIVENIKRIRENGFEQDELLRLTEFNKFQMLYAWNDFSRRSQEEINYALENEEHSYEKRSECFENMTVNNLQELFNQFLFESDSSIACMSTFDSDTILNAYRNAWKGTNVV